MPLDITVDISTPSDPSPVINASVVFGPDSVNLAFEEQGKPDTNTFYGIFNKTHRDSLKASEKLALLAQAAKMAEDADAKKPKAAP